VQVKLKRLDSERGRQPAVSGAQANVCAQNEKAPHLGVNRSRVVRRARSRQRSSSIAATKPAVATATLLLLLPLRLLLRRPAGKC
jgi:hypothetical protein